MLSAVNTPAEVPATIDSRSPVPKYYQLREILLDLIERELTVDAPVPSERELAARYGLSRMTARQAIEHLVSEGKLYRVQGRGTFVARPKIVMPLRLTSFSEDMRARGMIPGARDLGRRSIEAPAAVARELGVEAGAPIYVVERLRTADGVPMALEWLLSGGGIDNSMRRRTCSCARSSEKCQTSPVFLVLNSRPISCVLRGDERHHSAHGPPVSNRPLHTGISY